MPVMNKKGVMLPAEHGAWGLIAEPILLGLLIAPRLAGFSLAIFSFCAFLLRTPMLRLLRARRAPAPDPHGPLVRRFTLIVSLSGLSALLLGAITARSGTWIWPFLLALPPGLWTLREQDRGRTRTLWPELIAALAIGAPAAAIPLAAGIPAHIAYTLWGLLALKSISAILYVRCLIKRFHGRSCDLCGMLTLHTAIPAMLLVLGFPSAITVPFLLLAVRAAVFSFYPLPSPKHIGWTEVAVSLAFITALGTFPLDLL